MPVRSIFVSVFATLITCAFAAPSPAAEPPCPPILDHKFVNLMDEPISLCQFRGKVALIVNTASECGYTPQYDGLEKLYRRSRPTLCRPRLSGQRFRRPGAGVESTDRPVLPGELRHHLSNVCQDRGGRRQCQPAVSPARDAHRTAAQMEFSQVSRR